MKTDCKYSSNDIIMHEAIPFLSNYFLRIKSQRDVIMSKGRNTSITLQFLQRAAPIGTVIRIRVQLLHGRHGGYKIY